MSPVPTRFLDPYVAASPLAPTGPAQAYAAALAAAVTPTQPQPPQAADAFNIPRGYAVPMVTTGQGGNIPRHDEYRPPISPIIPVLEPNGIGGLTQTGTYVVPPKPPSQPTRLDGEPPNPPPPEVYAQVTQHGMRGGVIEPASAPKPAQQIGHPVAADLPPTHLLAAAGPQVLQVAAPPPAPQPQPQTRAGNLLRQMLGAPQPAPEPVFEPPAGVRVDFSVQYEPHAEAVDSVQYFEAVLVDDTKLVFIGNADSFELPPSLPSRSVALQLGNMAYLAMTIDLAFEYAGKRFGVMVIEQAQRADNTI